MMKKYNPDKIEKSGSPTLKLRRGKQKNMAKYNHSKIEKKWQKKWKDSGIYKNYDKENKFYALDMFPYPSGSGLHVGHPKGYIATDIFSRMKMMQGFSVLHPMGWDAFGLPAENYALQNKTHPKEAVEKNIKVFKKQLGKFGFTYDWGKEINTTDPEYYKWTQWIFLKMFDHGLAYESDEPVNWCPDCKTVLANEDLEGGKCERCGSEVTQKKLRQWVLKMTQYADRLLQDLDSDDLDWEEHIVQQQKNWIGRSEGAQFKMSIKGTNDFIEVYTTRLDTSYGMTYAVVAPEHPIIEKISNFQFPISNRDEVMEYIAKAQNKTEMERTALAKEKTGVRLRGVEVINPFTKESIPLFVADYVIGHYGTGAVMAVPAHDERDFEFAKKQSLEIKCVVCPNKVGPVKTYSSSREAYEKMEKDLKPFIDELEEIKAGKRVFVEDAFLRDSGVYSGMTSEEARREMTKWLEKEGLGEKKINYKMRDWVFSRQRYWGEPMPLVFCHACKKQAERFKSQIPNPKSLIGEENWKLEIGNWKFSLGELLNPGWIAVPESELPLKLPDVKSYEPTGTGESPLANIKEWVNTKCPKCGGEAKRETNTMPQWAGSSWYYLAYLIKSQKLKVKSQKYFFDEEIQVAFKKWLPVDLYVGGAEHATRHLLYARFWHKFLYDIGAVPTKEPFRRLVNVGLINGEDGRKMSKRWGNVINPDDIIAEYGADALRLYEMFMGPFTQNVAWNTDGLRGASRFLNRIWETKENVKDYGQISLGPEIAKGKEIMPEQKIEQLERKIHQTIKKVAEDIMVFRFNTAISSMMIFLNEMEKWGGFIPKNIYQNFIALLAPLAPHMCEEIWEMLGNKESIFISSWPAHDEKLVIEVEVDFIVQVNGKLRDTIKVSASISEEEAKKAAFASEKVKMYIAGKEISKIIFVKGRLINIVI